MQADKQFTKVLTLAEVGEIVRGITGSGREPVPTGRSGVKA